MINIPYFFRICAEIVWHLAIVFTEYNWKHSDGPGANLFYDLAFAAMILMYLTYTWGNSVHQQSKRKNAADFKDDE